MTTPHSIDIEDGFILYASLDGKPELGPDATEWERVCAKYYELLARRLGLFANTRPSELAAETFAFLTAAMASQRQAEAAEPAPVIEGTVIDGG